MVRSRVASALERAGETEAAFDMLTDSSRSVRLSAARPLAASQTIPDPIAKKDWDEYIEFNSDRPQSLLMLANTANREGRPADTKKYVERAIKLDQLNPEMYHQAAILLSAAKLNELAKQALNKGWGLAPKNPSFPYSLGLIAAEEQDLQTAIGYLEETVAIEPRFSRAWYNLSLAYRQVNRAEDAARALQRAQVGQ